jgi:hypothetical protein
MIAHPLEPLVTPLTNAGMKSNIPMTRIWAMPSKWTFTIKPIKNLLQRYVSDGRNWVDPFAGENSPAEITNDLNPDRPTKFHLEAKEFCKQLPDSLSGVLFDPPYSPRQISECYKGIGREVFMTDTQTSFYSDVKNLLAPKVKTGGIVICCGWNSMGFGINRGFEMIEILLVPHGGAKNDTIVTVERKLAGLFDPQ